MQIVIFAVIAVFLVAFLTEAVEQAGRSRIARMNPEELSRHLAEKAEQVAAYWHGPKAARGICPHCQAEGTVRTRSVTPSAADRSARGTPHPEPAAWTRAYCDQCRSRWLA